MGIWRLGRCAIYFFYGPDGPKVQKWTFPGSAPTRPSCLSTRGGAIGKPLQYILHGSCIFFDTWMAIIVKRFGNTACPNPTSSSACPHFLVAYCPGQIPIAPPWWINSSGGSIFGFLAHPAHKKNKWRIAPAAKYPLEAV